MESNRSLAIAIALVTLLLILGAGVFLYISVYGKSQPNKSQNIVSVHKSYIAEVQDPKWAIGIAELVIQGDIVETGSAADGVSPVNGGDVVYTDNLVKITKIDKNTSGKAIKPGDVINVRVLGGSTKKLTYMVDTARILIKGKHNILCLVDVSKMPEYPIDKSKEIYTIVGDYFGAFELDAERTTATRLKTEDVYKVDFLEKLAETSIPEKH